MSASRIFPIAIAAPLLLSPAFSPLATAGEPFSQQRLDPKSYVLVAAPDTLPGNRRLVILEELGQASETCWIEQEGNPTLIPASLNLHLGEVCDSRSGGEAYSIRVAGKDVNDDYQLQLVEHDGDVLLLGRPAMKGEASLLIGRSRGVADFAKIELLPDWDLAQRVHAGQAMRHLYLTTDKTLAQIDDPLQFENASSAMSVQELSIQDLFILDLSTPDSATLDSEAEMALSE